jgi:signal transduction histidine kinase
MKTKPRFTDGYSDEYRKLGVTPGEYVKFRATITLIGIPALLLALTSGSLMAFFVIMGAFVLLVWKMDPAEQIPRRQKAAAEKAEYEEKIRQDERNRIARGVYLAREREVIDAQ